MCYPSHFYFSRQEGFLTPEEIYTPTSCSIVFGVAGWTTTMEIMDKSGCISKRILTKHYFKEFFVYCIHVYLFE